MDAVADRDFAIELLSALSGREAEQVLRQTPNIALILLDVVMEQDDAGLRLVRKVRDTLRNDSVRIILRTGQPGQAPEMEVITDYDINDYRAKTELTQERLCACIVSALRSYQHIRRLETNNRNLARVIDATAGMFRANNLHRFLDFALSELLQVAGGTGDAVFCATQRDHVTLTDQTVVVNGFGRYAADVAKPIQSVLSEDETQAIERVIAARVPEFGDERTILHLAISGHWSGAILIPAAIPETSELRNVVVLFTMVMTAALDNFYLLDELRRSNKATVVALADLAEHRDADTGEHVLRVARLSSEIAWQLSRDGVFADQIDPMFLESLSLAAILHDIGKVGVPDRILRKPGRLDADERLLMESHARIGSQTLDKARRLVCSSRYLDIGREVALGHHERFDGRGYPNKLKGNEIPLSARIVAVADVFDALTTPRAYKAAWRLEDGMAHIAAGASTQFDPAVVEAFQTVMAQSLVNVRVRWTSEMSVGDPHLDEDHRRLINLVNLLAAAGERQDRSTIETVIDELVHYTEMHFSHEEEHMEHIGFPNFEAHKEQHAYLSEQVIALRDRFFNGLPGKLSDDIISFLGTWLSRHILIEDRQYHQYRDLVHGARAAAAPDPSCNAPH